MMSFSSFLLSLQISLTLCIGVGDHRVAMQIYKTLITRHGPNSVNYSA